MARRDQGTRTEGARRRSWPPRVATAVVAAAVVAFASGVAATATVARGKPPKPTSTATATATTSPGPTATATASPSPSPTASVSPTSGPSTTPTPTVSSSPSPSASTVCTLGYVEHEGSQFCHVTAEDVALDHYPRGTAVALLDVVVEEVWDGVMYLGAGDDCEPPPEPPNEPVYCGATIRTAAVDVSGVTVPSVDEVVDVWGSVTGSAWVTAADLDVAS